MQLLEETVLSASVVLRTLIAALLLQPPLAAAEPKARVGFVGPLAREEQSWKGFEAALAAQSAKADRVALDNACKTSETMGAVQRLIAEKVDLVVLSSCGYTEEAVKELSKARIPVIFLGLYQKKLPTSDGIQFSAISLEAAKALEREVKSVTTLDVDQKANCWNLGKEGELPAVCPLMKLDQSQQKRTTEALQKGGADPSSPSSIFGYAAGQVAAGALKDWKPGQPLGLSGKTYSTVFGAVGSGGQASSPRQSLLIVVPQRFKTVSDRDAEKVLESMKKDKDCGCGKKGDCPQGMEALMKAKPQCCTKSSDCPQGSLAW